MELAIFLDNYLFRHEIYDHCDYIWVLRKNLIESCEIDNNAYSYSFQNNDYDIITNYKLQDFNFI